MKFIQNTLNFFGALISVVLSFVLVAVLMVTPCMFAVQMTLEPATIQQIIVELSGGDLAQQPEDPQKAFLQQMMQTQTAQDLIGLYVDDLYAQMGGAQSGMTRGELQQIIENNMDELLPIFRQLAQQTGVDLSALTDAQLEAKTMQLVEQYSAQLLNKLPTLEQIGVTPIPEPAVDSLLVIDMDVVDRLLSFEFRRADVGPILTQGLLLLKDYTGLKLLGFVAGLLSLLILFFRLGGGFRGFSWLGTDYILGSVFCIVLGLYGKFMAWQMSGRSDMPPIFGALQPILNWLLIGAAAIFLLGILSAVISAAGNSVLSKRHKKRTL